VTQENCAPSRPEVSPLLEVQEEPDERRSEARSKLCALEYHKLEYIASNVVRDLDRGFLKKANKDGPSDDLSEDRARKLRMLRRCYKSVDKLDILRISIVFIV
jgi:hypothetical protein